MSRKRHVIVETVFVNVRRSVGFTYKTSSSGLVSACHIVESKARRNFVNFFYLEASVMPAFGDNRGGESQHEMFFERKKYLVMFWRVYDIFWKYVVIRNSPCTIHAVKWGMLRGTAWYSSLSWVVLEHRVGSVHWRDWIMKGRSSGTTVILSKWTIAVLDFSCPCTCKKLVGSRNWL